ncbi:hypothetical protein CH63R_11711 [Colletotrichum higginsianum IMI 349063]|uniref:Uncharacterized protein n=1 Tax=Colletotrichum higginsianum (strain IMI 349063) TaxID=759273 RepID=A0A1B7XZ00_COLHI|nr:hypothetical protein CH63R_11711 [Colletotrichum higginsianum IMI 349063]OBR05008.1 hypothetical protein CH63R_11711 [Colletotrichum higginsianum IMI 349063]GJC99646.1 hypothetical protein ColKHC_08472 [Colletotrichum higginsianum]
MQALRKTDESRPSNRTKSGGIHLVTTYETLHERLPYTAGGCCKGTLATLLEVPCRSSPNGFTNAEMVQKETNLIESNELKLGVVKKK